MKLYLKVNIEPKRKNTVCVTSDHMKMGRGWNMLRMPTDSDFDKIDKWVKDAGIGRRTAYDRWQLNSKQSVTAFLLAWDGKAL